MMKPSSTESSASPEHVSDTSTCKYKGVRKRKWGKWVSEIRLPNSRERIWLGSYDSAEKAARAFDAALYCLRGRDAKFNFPESPPEIVGGRTLSPHQIQMAAKWFAYEVEEKNRRTQGNNINDSTTTTHNSSNDNNVETEKYTSPSSVSFSDDGVAKQVETHHETMDWSAFLSMSDTNQEMSDNGFDPGLYNLPDDQLYPPPISTPPIDDNDDDEQNCGYDFSQPSFLWNF